jgi:hypothetical protein
MFRRWVRLYAISNLLNPDASHAIISWGKELRGQILGLADMDSVFIPVFPTAGFFELPSNNKLLPRFWLAFVEAVVNEDLTVSRSHKLVFLGSNNEFEITDEWGGGWFLIIRNHSDDSDRSRSNTPVRRRSPVAMTMDAAYLLNSP